MPRDRTPRLTGPGYFGSDKAVKDSLKKGKMSEIRALKDGESLTIRFLEEPDKWFGYNEHWMKDGGPIPCIADDCTGCDSDEESERRKNPRYLVNVYCADENKVIPLKMTKTAADIAFRYYEKRGTILDRDYEFSRSGAGMQDTKYLLEPDVPSKFSKKVKLLDLEAIVMSMLGDFDEDDDEEEEEDRPARRRPTRTRPRNTRDEDPYEDDDEDDDEDEEERPVRRRSAIKRTAKKSTRTVRRTR